MIQFQDTAIVLAGGSSRRLGQDKRQLRLWGENGPTLLEHTVGVVGELCAEVIVVLNDSAAWQQLPARLVPDVYPGEGPLGGIVSGLVAAQHEYALVVACDMPELNERALATLLSWPRPYDALVPQAAHAQRNRAGIEPLHAVYHQRCYAPAAGLLANGERRVAALFNQVATLYVPWNALAPYDLAMRGLRSVNTADDLPPNTL